MALGDPKHCKGYGCCTIGYNDGYNDAQNGISPAYTCLGHSELWCIGYNNGFRAGNRSSNICYGQRSDQSVNLNINGDNNQHDSNQVGDKGHKTAGGALPNCVILCLNSDIRIE